jgi:hypothetical protein
LFPLFGTDVVYTGAKFAAGVVETGGNLPPTSLTSAANLPQVLLTPVANWWCTLTCEFSKKFEINATVIFRGLGEGDYEKNLKQKIS